MAPVKSSEDGPCQAQDAPPAATSPQEAQDPSGPEASSVEPLTVMAEVVTSELVSTILESIDPNLNLLDFTSEPGTEVGDNYMSIMYAVDIRAKDKGTGAEKTIHTMLKTMPRNAFRQQMINDCQAFVKDSKMYTEVFPVLMKFQKEVGLGEDEIFNSFPTCYASLCNGETDFLAMDNLRMKGYKMANRQTGLDYQHCVLVMKTLAKFHALSYAKFKGNYDELIKTFPFLTELMFRPADAVPDMQKAWLSQTFTKEIESLQEAGYPDEATNIEILHQSQFWSKMNHLLGNSSQISVVGHGDCWTNNFLFKYDEDTGKPIDIKLVDFQISRVCSRTIDLNYFLHTSPYMRILNEKERDLLEVYHDEFVRFSKRLGFHEESDTLQAFIDEYEAHRYYGVALGLMLGPIMCAQQSDVPDMESLSGELDGGDVDKFYKDIMKNNVSVGKILNLAKVHVPKLNL